MKLDKNLVSGSTTMLVLSLLAREEMYGHRIGPSLDHTFELKEGTLYPMLHGLEADNARASYKRRKGQRREPLSEAPSFGL